MTPQQIIDNWNKKHAVGTHVQITNGVGSITQTTTTAPAMLLAKTQPVVFLKNIHNAQPLSKLLVMQINSTPNSGDNHEYQSHIRPKNK